MATLHYRNAFKLLIFNVILVLRLLCMTVW